MIRGHGTQLQSLGHRDLLQVLLLSLLLVHDFPRESLTEQLDL